VGDNSGAVTARRRTELLTILSDGVWKTAGEVGGKRSSWHSHILLELSTTRLVDKEKRTPVNLKFGFYYAYRITPEGLKALRNGGGGHG